MKTVKSRHEIRDIPDTEGGVYWFKLRFHTAYSFGISGDFTDASLNRLVNAIVAFSQIVNNINIKSMVNNKSALNAFEFL